MALALKKLSALEQKFVSLPLAASFNVARLDSKYALSEVITSSTAAAAQSSSTTTTTGGTTTGGFETMPPPRPLTNADIVLAMIVNKKLAPVAGKERELIKALKNIDIKLSPEQMVAKLRDDGLLQPEKKLVLPAPKPTPAFTHLMRPSFAMALV